MWTIYRKPDGQSVEAWHVTDLTDTPQNIEAMVGQVICREYLVPGQSSIYVRDAVDPGWTREGELPAGVKANEVITIPPSPRQDLWNLSEAELRERVVAYGIDPPVGARKKWYVDAMSAAVNSGPEAVVLTAEKPPVVIPPAPVLTIDEDGSDG